MARITVEDCLEKLNNRFELTLLAAKRARQLVKSGAEPLVPWENDKCTVVALREIAEGLVSEQFMKDQERAKEDDMLLSATDLLAQAAQAASEAAEVIEMEVKLETNSGEEE